MRYTLLDLTQSILSSIDGDEINSVTDTNEAGQVVTVIKTVYFDLVSRAGLPEQYDFVNLIASGNSAKPVLMTLPSNVVSVEWLKYDKRLSTDTVAKMQPVTWQPLVDFVDRMHGFDASDTTNYGTFSHTVGATTYTVTYNKKTAPTYYTTTDDHTVLFDSYDNTVDTTLQSSKTLAYCKLQTPFTVSDTFDFPYIDEEQHPLLLNEAKALAWAELRQAQHGKAEQSARRGWTHLQKSKNAVSKTTLFDELPNYGRR